ncbi:MULTISPECIES: helix-turn-helix domain-containing protein [unclassified Pseudomonas]|nr:MULTISPECIES: helix-turn-helix domain-containing protein [unclassified Pseudomonas]
MVRTSGCGSVLSDKGAVYEARLNGSSVKKATLYAETDGMPVAAIFLYDNCYASSVGGFADVLQVANAHLAAQNSAQRYTWSFLAPKAGGITTSNGLPLQARQPEPGEHFDIVYIPACHYLGYHSFRQFLDQQSLHCEWLCRQWEVGAELIATCTGTFVLANTGLLDGRVATTTWWLEEQFRAWFPAVDLQMAPILTQSDRLFCAGALSSYHLQSIQTIERHSGAALAAQCAKSLLIDVSQTLQTPYLPLLAHRSHSDAVVQQAQDYLERHLADPIRLTDLAKRLAVSERTLIRRFHLALEQTPLAYLQSLRIEAARTMLETGNQRIESIAQAVGYLDSSSFVRLFRERIGLTPAAYRRKFRLGG